MKWIKWFLNIDNLTFLMAALGFMYAVLDAAASWLRSKENYKLSVIDYASRETNVIQFLVGITNNSNEPLIISEMSVFGTTCELLPKPIRGNPEKWNFQHTIGFPVCIEAHGCCYAFLEFVAPGIGHNQLDPGITVSFQIRSTRKLARKNTTLGSRSHYLHKRERSPVCHTLHPNTDACDNQKS